MKNMNKECQIKLQSENAWLHLAMSLLLLIQDESI